MPSPGRRISAVGAVLLCVLVLALVSACGGTEIKPPRPRPDDGDARTAAATDLLRRLQTGLRERDRAAVIALAAPDARSEKAVRAIYDNVVALDLDDVMFRYVDESGAAGGRRWTAAVAVAWQLPADGAPSRLTTRMTFQTEDGRTRLVGAGGGSQRGALWLTAALDVARGRSSLVQVSRSGVDPVSRYASLARQAVLDVRKVVPDWRGELVVEVPPSESDLEQLLHAQKGEYRQIAAVTTTVDGSLDRGSAVHVFINPAVFDRLGPRGAQVVLSHETTHVATDATFDHDMPLWLTEGFADFVALAYADVPVPTAAGQILRRVRREGAPRHLPSAKDLSPSATGLGATYEEAWTVCRQIGRRYGQQKMVDFYQAVRGGTSPSAAFRSVLGTSQAAFVQDWRADLTALAAGRPG